MGLLILLVMFASFIIGMPIAFTILLTSILLLIFVVGGLPLELVAQRMASSVDSFILLAVPLFIMAGRIMNSGGITDRIFNFCRVIVGHIRGGLGHVNILASLIFAGLSGAAVADASGLGEIEINAMKKRGYDGVFSAAITAASSTIGPIFPPSIPILIYGAMAEVSVGKLFLAGALPGILMALFMMGATYVLAVKRNYPQDPRAKFSEALIAFKEAFLPLMAPVIILGFIILGITTPTEAAVIAVLYSILLGFIYKTLKIKDIVVILKEVATDAGVLLFIISTISVFSWTITFQMIPQTFISTIFSLTSSYAVIMFLTVVVLLFIGFFMNPTPGLILSIPFLLPLADKLGVDPVHFGVLMVLVLSIGLLTPPVGLCIYIVAKVGKVDVKDVVVELLPFIAVLILVALLVAYVKEFTLFLPGLFF